MMFLMILPMSCLAAQQGGAWILPGPQQWDTYHLDKSEDPSKSIEIQPMIQHGVNFEHQSGGYIYRMVVIRKPVHVNGVRARLSQHQESEGSKLGKEIDQRVRREQGLTGQLSFSLMWEDDSDLDLHLMTPNGKHIHWKNKIDDAYNGFELDVDANRDGDNIMMCNGEYSPVENIVFLKKRWQEKMTNGQFKSVPYDHVTEQNRQLMEKGNVMGLDETTGEFKCDYGSGTFRCLPQHGMQTLEDGEYRLFVRNFFTREMKPPHAFTIKVSLQNQMEERIYQGVSGHGSPSERHPDINIVTFEVKDGEIDRSSIVEHQDNVTRVQ